MFLSLKLDIRGLNLQSSIRLPLGVATNHLSKVKYDKENSNFNYLLSSQDTKLSATGKLSNKINMQPMESSNLRQGKSSRETLKHYS